jgi:prefoldin beta subunit
VSHIQEFSQLSPQNTVYKLIGPALIKQDQAEAKDNVRKRLDFIAAEMCVFI